MVWYSLESSYDSTVYTDDRRVDGEADAVLPGLRVQLQRPRSVCSARFPTTETEQSTVPDAAVTTWSWKPLVAGRSP